MDVRGVEPADIATALGMPEASAWCFARNIERHYKPARDQKVGRKVRGIDPLFKPAKRRLKSLHKWFQKRRLFHPAAHGGIRKRSCFTSAEPSSRLEGRLDRDAKDCYPSITPEAFCKEMRMLGFRSDTARLLTMLCTVRGRIPQGSPVSNDAPNLFFWRADQGLSSFVGSRRSRYTRVADDFVVSSNLLDAGDRAARMIEVEINSRGVRVNDKKRRETGLQLNSKVQTVHSINVTQRRGATIGRQHWETARDLAERYVLSCRSVQPSTLLCWQRYCESLAGWMHYCRQAMFGPSAYLYRQLCAGDRHVRRVLGRLGITAYKSKWWLMSRKRNEPTRIAQIWRQRLEQRSTAPQAV